MYDFKRTESEVLDFWDENEVFDKSLDARKKAKRFVFFEGPPTANGKPGIHHFLGRSFKDLYGRYKTMRGFFVLRKAGWDTHGLPVEIEIEKQLGFKNKKDIEEYGIDKFNRKARESVWKYKVEWEEMTKKMGFWLNMKDPYVTYETKYIESLWYIIKQIWKKKLLYLAHRVVPFCTRCGTSLSSHEVAQGYKTVTDKSATVKFKLKGQPVYVLAWTTTPWTLPGNVALAVGSDIEYIYAKKDGETYIVAKALAEKVLGEYSIDGRAITGKELIGLSYEPLFDVPELKSKNSYKIYDADFVSTEDGTGVVHTAVMYGEDDYQFGTKHELPKVHTVTEQGKFVGVGKELDGRYVKDPKTEELVIRQLEIRNLLFKVENFEHEYPFCWRCDSPLLYYAKSSWFIKMTAVRNQLLKNNSKVNWFPSHIKEGRFGQWLSEGKDWAFSRERYWGTPLPIWQCQKCSNFKVIESIAEIEKFGVAPSKNNYYILRHGNTTRDEDGEMIISSDIKADKYHLTDKGQQQIQKAAEYIKNNYNIDLIFSSPFMRTMESAEIVAKALHVNINKDDRLTEINHGGCEGDPHNACPIKDKKRDMDSKPHDPGESWNDVRRRVMNFIQEMESKYSGKNILIVSHGDPLWLLHCASQGALGEEIVAESRDGRFHYPGIADRAKLDWKVLPRNELGEIDLHRPYIDKVSLECDHCEATMKKIPDLIDVWFDSGSMPFAQWHWPFENEDMFKKQFPADFIVEGIDQTRGWFYTLLSVSTLLGKGNPYKNVMSLGHVLDEKGKKMSKSKGNVVSPFEVIERVGADTARWYFYTVNQPGEYKNFAIKDVESKLKGFVSTLENCVKFYELYGEGSQGFTHNSKATHLLDEWLLSRLNGLISDVSDNLDNYDPTSAARSIEKFVMEDFSNWWLRRSRKRKEALGVLRFVLLELAKVIAPFMPFIAENIHRRMYAGHDMGILSVHLHDWPSPNKKLIDKKLEEKIEQIRNVVTTGLAQRKENQLKVRQPLKSVSLKLKEKCHADLEQMIKDELNVKEVIYNTSQETDVVLNTELDPALIGEGYARELIRQIQDMRKEAKYKVDDKIFGQWHSDDEDVKSAVEKWSDMIKEGGLFKEFKAGSQDAKVYDVQKEFNLASGKSVWVGIRK